VLAAVVRLDGDEREELREHLRLDLVRVRVRVRVRARARVRVRVRARARARARARICDLTLRSSGVSVESEGDRFTWRAAGRRAEVRGPKG